MTDLRQRYHRILKARKLSLTGVSQYAEALLDAVEERLDADRQQVASNWQSHVSLAKEVKAIKSVIQPEE